MDDDERRFSLKGGVPNMSVMPILVKELIICSNMRGRGDFSSKALRVLPLMQSTFKLM